MLSSIEANVEQICWHSTCQIAFEPCYREVYELSIQSRERHHQLFLVVCSALARLTAPQCFPMGAFLVPGGQVAHSHMSQCYHLCGPQQVLLACVCLPCCLHLLSIFLICKSLDIKNVIKWLGNQRRKQFLSVKKKDLSKLAKWVYGKNEIYHKSKKFFKIVGLRINSNFYSKKRWDQPIIVQN